MPGVGLESATRTPRAKGERTERAGKRKGGTGQGGSRAGDTQTHGNHMAGDEKYHATLRKRKTRRRKSSQTAKGERRANKTPENTRRRAKPNTAGNGPSRGPPDTRTPAQGLNSRTEPQRAPQRTEPRGAQLRPSPSSAGGLRRARARLSREEQGRETLLGDDGDLAQRASQRSGTLRLRDGRVLPQERQHLRPEPAAGFHHEGDSVGIVRNPQICRNLNILCGIWRNSEEISSKSVQNSMKTMKNSKHLEEILKIAKTFR